MLQEPITQEAGVLDRLQHSGGFGRSENTSNMATHPDALPNAEKAVIRTERLQGYALNFDHPEGMHKAKVFEAKLGITAKNQELLVSQIRQGLPLARATPKLHDEYGQRYSVDVPVTGPDGSGMVTTAWIIRPGSDVLEMISVYVRR